MNDDHNGTPSEGITGDSGEPRFFVAPHTSPDDWRFIGTVDDYATLQSRVLQAIDDVVVPVVLRIGEHEFEKPDFEAATGDVHLTVHVDEGHEAMAQLQAMFGDPALIDPDEVDPDEVDLDEMQRLLDDGGDSSELRREQEETEAELQRIINQEQEDAARMAELERIVQEEDFTSPTEYEQEKVHG